MIKPIYLLILFVSMNVMAQFGPQQIISTETLGARSISVVDIDGDNLKDVVTANKFDSSIFWFKNVNGTSFSSQNFVSTLNQPISIYVADIDGDEDLDILSLSGPDGLVVWYENLDGLGNFSSQNIITDEVELPYTVIAADLDGDLDNDVILGSDNSGIAWFENLDGLGNFGPTQEINFLSPSSRSVIAIDLDGDTDLDIASVSTGSVTISWYKNLDGQGGFGSQRVIAGAALAVQSIFGSDLDGDDDIDIIAATSAENKVAWFENLNGQGTFGSENIITTNAEFARSVFAADLDNDLDNDVLSASSLGPKIAWYENVDGQGNFGEFNIISTETEGKPTVFAADIDNDGDKDVFSTSEADDKVAWYENLTILSIDDIDHDGITISPNPIIDHLVISNVNPSEIISISIYDILGRIVLLQNESFEQIDVSALGSGLFLVNIETEQGIVVRKIVKE